MHDFLFQEKRASDADPPNKLESDAKLASKIHIFAGGGAARTSTHEIRRYTVRYERMSRACVVSTLYAFDVTVHGARTLLTRNTVCAQCTTRHTICTGARDDARKLTAERDGENPHEPLRDRYAWFTKRGRGTLVNEPRLPFR